MGKGASTSKTNVTKTLPDYKVGDPGRSSGSGAEGGSAPDSEVKNVCLITFQEELQFKRDAADLIRVGFQFTLVPNDQGRLESMGSGRVVGSYSGSKSALLKRCIKSGYIYRGIVQSINGDRANCEITGFGVSDGAATTM